MKKYFVLLFVTIGLSSFLPVQAADALFRMTHGGQDALVLGKVIALDDSTARVQVFSRLPGNKIAVENEIEIRDLQASSEPYAQYYSLSFGKSYFLSVNKKADYYVLAWGVRELDVGTTYADAKFSRIKNADNAAVQWFMNSGGRDSDFYFLFDEGFVRTKDGDVRIYPVNSSNPIPPERNSIDDILVIIGVAVVVGFLIFRKSR